MAQFKRLSDTFLVAQQITLADVAEAAAQGVRVIVMNRPDGEEPGQPPLAEIEAAARAASIRFVHIPIRGMPPSADAVAATAALLEQEEGPFLAFCRSGTRSTYLWAFARASKGAEPGGLVSAAQAAGYDLSGQAGALAGLAGAAKA